MPLNPAYPPSTSRPIAGVLPPAYGNSTFAGALALAYGNTEKIILNQFGKYEGITYTQSGNLTYFDSTGTLKTAAVDTMVLDYDPSTLVVKGYPFWEARTNLLLQSEDFTTTWTTGGAGPATVTANTVNAPTGTQIADTILSTVANSDLVAQTKTVAASTTYVLSFFVKNNNATQSFFRFIGFNSGSANSNVTINWSGATLSSLTNGGTTQSSFFACQNGWYLVYMIFTTNGSDAGGASTVQFFPELVQASRSVYLFGAMLQAGSFYAPYIATTTGAVTRAAPSCLVTSTNFTSWYNPLEGTFVVQGLNSDTTSNQARIVCCNDNTANNYIDVSRLGNTAQSRTAVNVGGVNQFNSLVTAWPVNTSAKVATTYKVNNFAACLGGGTVVTDTSGTIPTVDRMFIGMFFAGANFWNGWVTSLTYYGSNLPGSVKSLST